MTEELLTRIRKGILDYQEVHSCTKEDLAEHFIRSIAFSLKNPGFKMIEIDGWKVLEEWDIGDPIIHRFASKEEAQEKFDELYPRGASPEAKKHLMYEAPIDFVPKAGGQERSMMELTGKEDTEAIEIIVSKAKANIVANITDILNNLRGESETGDMNNVNPKSLSAAIVKSKSLQEELEMNKATTVLGLIKDDTTTGEKYVISKESWENQNMARKGEHLVFPNLAKMPIRSGKKTKSIGYSTLLELDRFLSGRLGVTVGMVLAKSHPKLARNFGANPEWRESIGGSPNSESSNREFNFGKHLGSNLREMIDEMANKGFDIQPIFDSRQGGNCIGIVKLSDVVGVLSDLSFNLRDEDTVATLKSYGAEGLIRSPPPQIDASTDLSVAGNILKHGNECIIVKFDPENWFGSEGEFEEIKKILEPGYHIMTSHDIIAYRLAR